MKNANGFGSVYKLSGKRRKPWAVRVTVGWDIDPLNQTIKQIRKHIGYYPTRAEALVALANYNSNPYDLDYNNITFSELYSKWSEQYYASITPSSSRSYVSAYNHSTPLYDMKMKEIRCNHLENTIKDAKVGIKTKERMKSLYNLMFDFADKNDIIDKNYARKCSSVAKLCADQDDIYAQHKVHRYIFTQDEFKLLWDNLDFPYVDAVLISLYTGWRPQELALIQLKDVDLENQTLTGGLKTKAGKGRVVPIHHKIFELVKSNYDYANSIGSKFLFNDRNLYDKSNLYMTYDKYRGRFRKVMKHLNLEHTPDDTRHTFISECKALEISDYVIKLLIGHELKDVTEKYYTHRTIEQLRGYVELIPELPAPEAWQGAIRDLL